MTGPGVEIGGESDRDWRPTASPDVLHQRAAMLADLRVFFARRDVLEVETPYISTAGTTDPNIASITVQGISGRFLHTSPEFAMKRLLAAGTGDIYQVCRVFRAGEAGRRHNPEFTMLEWYRLGFDHHRLMLEVAELLALLLRRPLGEPEILTYREAYLRHTGLDPFTATAQEWQARLADAGLEISEELQLDAWLDLAGTELVHPELGCGRISFIHDYPASQAALYRVRPGVPPVAERFEAFVDGIELANGFHELADTKEQADRFKAERDRRAADGLPDIPADDRLLAALASGLPDCAGVALGLDRVLMLRVGADHIGAVLAFPADRA